MSNNIYDILNKFPKDLPISTSKVDIIYESLDTEDDLNHTVKILSEKFDKYKVNSEDESRWLNPKAKRTVQLAKAKYPETASDLEAVIASLGDKTEELDQRDRETAAWMDKAKSTIDNQQREIEQTEQAINDANARYDAQEQRFQDFNQQVAAMNLPPPEQAKAAIKLAQQPQATAGDVATQVRAQQPSNVVPLQRPQPVPAQEQPPADEVSPEKQTPADELEPRRQKKQTKIQSIAANDDELSQWLATGTDNPTPNQLQEQVQYPVGSKALGQYNWELIKKAYGQKKPQLTLFFGDKGVNLDASEIYAMVAWFFNKSKKNWDLMPNLSGLNLSDTQSVEKLMMSNMFTSYKSNYNTIKRRQQLQQKKAPVAPLDFDKPKPAVEPKTEPAPEPVVQKHKTGQLDLFYENHNMKTLDKLQKNLMERFASFKEAAKPDFLDLDKDGDTEEPMKAAAKSAKDDEPAKPDSDAVAKRKRLQALKDRQEDERAEKDDYDTKSSSRKIKGRAYGGAAQKDDEEKDLDESGLQAYLGKKKYGKEGMKALQKAGREGASKEKMALIRAKHDKMDEARPSRADKVTKDLTSIADKKGYKSAKDFTRQDWDKVAKPHGYTGKEIAAVRGHKVAEVAPPGAKAERMVKHIKKGYAKDGNLSKKEKGIAYATAWKAHNKGAVEEATEFGDKIKNSKAELKKHKMVKESRNHESSEYTYETVGRILSEEQPGLDCNSEAFVKAVYDELIEMKMTPKAARWLCHYDEDFLSDTASAYSHFCDSKTKEAMECDAPMNSFVSEEPVVDAVEELDEIARLAGLPKMESKCSSCGCADCECNESSCMIDESAINEAATRKDFRMVADLLKAIPDIAKRTELAMYHADIFKQQNSRFKKEMFLAAAGVDTTPIKDESIETEGNAFTGKLAATPKGGEFELDGKKFKDTSNLEEEEMEEGNEFSGALAKAKAAGEKEFEVDGKKYTVKEDINLNVSATGEEDVVNLIRKLSGMPVVAIQAQPAVAEEVVAEEGPKERDVEYTNTPREVVAGTDAAIPAGADLNRAKKQYKKEYPGDNPMAVAEAKEEQLWKSYEAMINDVKA